MSAEEDLGLASKKLMLAAAIASRRQANPIEWYRPGYPGMVLPSGRSLGRYAGQRAFHASDHKYRLLAPGNGWGKTTSMGAEVHWWSTGTHPYQNTPKAPIQSVWFVKLHEQFELVRAQLREQCFGDVAKWVDGKYLWPNGSKMFIGSADRSDDWRKWQGIPVDLVLFDEQPPIRLWEEMAMRRRGVHQTRYVIAATATDGNSWMEKTIYQPWLRHHQHLGLTEDEALAVQSYPSAFVWARGGILDNPSMGPADLAHYEEVTAGMHANERKVRLSGGFASWVGDGVFDASALEWLEEQIASLAGKHGPGTVGMLEPLGVSKKHMR